MELQGRTKWELGGLLAAALLIPGGSILLAWIYCRRFLSGTRVLQSARRWVPVAVLAALLQGCAAQFTVRPVSENADAAASGPVLQFQNSSIAPKHGAAILASEVLLPGDIILTSEPTFVSAAIRATTMALVSHAAIYVGDGKVVEAVRPAVRVRSLDDLLAKETIVLVLRHPELSAEQAQSIRDYALQKPGTAFNYLGVTLHLPFSIGRRLCELPIVPSAPRDACIRTMGSINYMAASEQRFFCSQLVLDAYRQVGLPITDADPRLVSPSDILHMREGDVSSIRIHRQLRYLGHLKFDAPAVVALQQ